MSASKESCQCKGPEMFQVKQEKERAWKLVHLEPLQELKTVNTYSLTGTMMQEWQALPKQSCILWVSCPDTPAEERTGNRGLARHGVPVLYT